MQIKELKQCYVIDPALASVRPPPSPVCSDGRHLEPCVPLKGVIPY